MILTSRGPKKIDFNQTERITARLRDLVRNYPKGLGLVKEFLQNADDAGATRLLMIYDRRQHNGTFSDYPNMGVALGPSLLFINDQIFSAEDFKRIQQIGEGGKVREAARTGRFGQGFNTCYSVSDHPSLLTGDFIAWFDPHHRVFGDEANATAWRPLAEVEAYWPDWIKTFEPAGWMSGAQFFPGTAFRLPLRSAKDAETSEILKESFTNDDFLSILDELAHVGAALLVFLRSVSHLEIREIDSDGNDNLRLCITTENASEVEDHRKVLRSVVDGNPKELLENWIKTKSDLPVGQYDHLFSIYDAEGSKRDELWSIVTGLFRGPDDLLLHSALEVLKHDEKAIPWAGAAVCRNKSGVNHKYGGLACFLPLPEQSKWPVWLHGWFDLSSNRRGITRDADVGETTKTRQSWNRSLMEYAVGKAWALLIESIQGLPEESHNPYEYWLRPPDKPDDVDSALVCGFYKAVADLPVIRVRDYDGHKWNRIDQIRDLPDEWNERLSSPLLAEGWVLSHPSLPEFVRKELYRINRFQSYISPESLRAELKQEKWDSDIACNIEHAPRPMLRKREWIHVLTEFCAGSNFDNLERLPLALLSDGLLHTYTSCGKLFLASTEERFLLSSLPERFFDHEYQKALALNVASEKINLVAFDLSGLLEFVPLFLTKTPLEHLWLTAFFNFLTSADGVSVGNNKDNLKKLLLLEDQGANLWQMGLVKTPLIPGKEPKELLNALTELGIPILTVEDDLRAAISRFSSKHKGFVWELTPKDIADNLKAHVEKNCLNEGALDKRKFLEPILDFLTSSSWLSDTDDRLPFLRQLKLLPTTCGQRVAAQDENVYIPGFKPPEGFEGKYILLDLGQGERWLSLFCALKVSRLDGVRFVRRVLLPAFKNATLDQCQGYLKWLRDDFRLVAAKISEEERKELRNEIRQKPILPIEGGGLSEPRLVYRPEAKIPSELLGNVARFPDKMFFSEDKDLWSEFFEEYDLPRLPLARDLYSKIKALSDEITVSGIGQAKPHIRKLIDYVSDKWQSISSRKAVGTLTLAEALAKTAWLPASVEGSNYAACEKWPDRLWRANEIVPGRLAHLCASKYPILEGPEFQREMSDAVGLITNLNLTDVIQHFSKVRNHHIHDDKSIDAVNKGAEAFYRYIGQLDSKTDFLLVSQLDVLKDQLCIFVDGKWWHPSQCFFDPLPFPTDWAVSLTMSNLNVSDYSANKGLTFLGVRQRPDNDDWLLLLTDFSDKFQGKSLPQAELNQVRHVIRLFRSATTEWLLDQDVYIPLNNGRIELARRTLVPDDPRLKKYSGGNFLPLIEDNDDAFDVGRRSGAQSLRGALIERLKTQPEIARNSTHSDLAVKLELRIRSKEFFESLQRIAYEEATRTRDNDKDPLEAAFADNLKLPRSMRIILSYSINVETVVKIDGEEIVVFDLESPSFLDKEKLRLWLKEGKRQRIIDDTVRAICELCGLSAQLRLSRVLEVDPDKMSSVLDDEEVATLPEGQTLVLGSDSETEIVLEYSDSRISEDYVDSFEMSPEGEENRNGQQTSYDSSDLPSVKDSTQVLSSGLGNTFIQADSNDSDELEPSGVLVPPIKPGYGSSSPWRDKSYDASEGQTLSDNSEDNLHAHLHRESQSSPKQFVKSGSLSPTFYPASSSPRSSSPQTNHGHYSGKPWENSDKRTHDASQQVRMRTYVHEKINDDYDTGDSDSRAKKLGDIGEEIVMEYEKKRKRSAKRMLPNHEGYDIESNGRDGTRYIEVKSIDGPWGLRGVGVSRAQYEAAIRLGRDWWLYVVEHVTDPSREKIHPIANPFFLATEFRFDSGWIGAQVDDSGVSLVSTKPKIGATYVRESGEIVTVEGTAQRGEFWRVSFTRDDGKKERVMWDASWRMV